MYRELQIHFLENRNVHYRWTKDSRVIEYEKVGFLEIVSQNPLQFAYRENISINASEDNCFHLYLHRRNRRFSALKSQSHAFFLPASRGYIHCCGAFLRSGRYECWEERIEPTTQISLRPTQLADVKFHASGVLQVDWILEIDESKNE